MDCGYELKQLQKIVDPIYTKLCEFWIKALSTDFENKKSGTEKSTVYAIIEAAKRITNYAIQDKATGDSILAEETPKACNILDTLLEQLSTQINNSDGVIDNQQLFETTKKIIISVAHILLLSDDGKCRLFASRCAQGSVLVHNSFFNGNFCQKSFEEFRKLILHIISDAETRQKELSSINQSAKISKILSCIIQLINNLTEYSASLKSNDTSQSHIELICKKIKKNLRLLALSYKHRNYYSDYCPRNAALFANCQEKLREIVSMDEPESHMIKCPQIREIIDRTVPISIFMTSECSDDNLKVKILKICHQIILSPTYKAFKTQDEIISIEFIQKTYNSLSDLRIALSLLACQKITEIIFKAPQPVEELIHFLDSVPLNEWNSKVDRIRELNKSLLNAFYFVAITSIKKDASLKLLRSIASMEDLIENVLKSKEQKEMKRAIELWKNQFGYSVTLASYVVDLSQFCDVCGTSLNNIIDNLARSNIDVPITVIIITSHAYQRASCYLAMVEEFGHLTEENNSKLSEYISMIISETESFGQLINEMISSKSIELLDSVMGMLKKISTSFKNLSKFFTLGDLE